jgi:hypothetical protein
LPHNKGTKWKFEDIFSKIYIVNFDVDHQKTSENTLEWICPLTVKDVFESGAKFPNGVNYDPKYNCLEKEIEGFGLAMLYLRKNT